MAQLTSTERELVALGAALGSNCIPCIEYHIPEARKSGLSDGQIQEAVHLADKVRQTPARKVLAAALNLLAGATQAGPEGACGELNKKADSSQAAAVDSPCCA